jgi:hypothetical protein
MNILSWAILIFAIIETLNILTLYFAPGTRRGNGLGVFDAFEESKQYPSIHNLIKYLIYWVAGTKLIFIMLLIVIIITGTWQTQLLAVGALILSILVFYWRLYPLIRQADKRSNITPKGYSRTLAIMIAAFIILFVVVFIIAII